MGSVENPVHFCQLKGSLLIVTKNYKASLNESSGATKHIFYKTKFSLQKLSSSPWTSAILTVKYKYATKHR